MCYGFSSVAAGGHELFVRIYVRYHRREIANLVKQDQFSWLFCTRDTRWNFSPRQIATEYSIGQVANGRWHSYAHLELDDTLVAKFKLLVSLVACINVELAWSLSL